MFGKTVAVDRVDLSIPAGSLFFLLGPSGCGKTTLLRMLAGFTQPTDGRIRFGDDDVTDRAANKRNCGMVFQSYALWPHMTVRENVAFGLKVRKLAGDVREKAVDEALRMVQMAAYGQRKPNELSGGQQQRVALARALVIKPTLLLLDEPLSNLDAKLRLDMRSQIRTICKDAGITGVYVTHDQKEAMSMADGIAVMRDGNVVQMGDPRTLYHRPANRFVADFLGETNFIPGEIVGREGDFVILETALGTLKSSTYFDDLPETGNVTCSIRPETIRLGHGDEPPKTDNVLDADHQRTMFLGEMAQYTLRIGDRVEIKSFELNARAREAGPVKIGVDARDVVILQD